MSVLTELILRHILDDPRTPAEVRAWHEREPDPHRRASGYGTQLSARYEEMLKDWQGRYPELVSGLLTAAIQSLVWPRVAQEVLRRFMPRPRLHAKYVSRPSVN